MCLAVEFFYEGKEYTPYFPNPYATLPVLSKNGTITLLPWGRRQSQLGNLPLGGWAKLESIQKNVWQKYFPKAVKLPITRFAEKDSEGKTHWFKVQDDQFIQGLLARYDNEVRVYIVTVTPTEPEVIHDRWPRILVRPEF
jgi:hypothetical protein